MGVSTLKACISLVFAFKIWRTERSRKNSNKINVVIDGFLYIISRSLVVFGQFFHVQNPRRRFHRSRELSFIKKSYKLIPHVVRQSSCQLSRIITPNPPPPPQPAVFLARLYSFIIRFRDSNFSKVFFSDAFCRLGSTRHLLNWKFALGCHPTDTDKKELQIFLIYKEIQNGAVAKSYMTNGLLLYGEIFAHFLIYYEASYSMGLCNFSLWIWGKFDFLFLSVYSSYFLW